MGWRELLKHIAVVFAFTISAIDWNASVLRWRLHLFTPAWATLIAWVIRGLVAWLPETNWGRSTDILYFFFLFNFVNGIFKLLSLCLSFIGILVSSGLWFGLSWWRWLWFFVLLKDQRRILEEAISWDFLWMSALPSQAWYFIRTWISQTFDKFNSSTN